MSSGFSLYIYGLYMSNPEENRCFSEQGGKILQVMRTSEFLRILWRSALWLRWETSHWQTTQREVCLSHCFFNVLSPEQQRLNSMRSNLKSLCCSFFFSLPQKCAEPSLRDSESTWWLQSAKVARVPVNVDKGNRQWREHTIQIQ